MMTMKKNKIKQTRMEKNHYPINYFLIFSILFIFIFYVSNENPSQISFVFVQIEKILVQPLLPNAFYR